LAASAYQGLVGVSTVHVAAEIASEEPERQFDAQEPPVAEVSLSSIAKASIAPFGSRPGI